MRPRASVVIPTFNGAQRLPRVLAALAAQTADDESFEVLVVDNASTDDTAKVALGDMATRRLRDRGIELRVVGEPRQGQTYARITGVKKAKSELICFLDDDNIPEREYVANGLKLFENPAFGLIVSQIYARWELEPPRSIEKREHLFAVNKGLGESPIDWGAVGTMVPTVTAGMWVRREAFLTAIPWDRPDLLVSGRIGGGQLVGGEDIELGVLIGKAGYHRGYAPSLRIAHEIPQWRLETRYVRRLIEAIVRGEMTLRMKYEGATFGSYERRIAAKRLFVAVCAIPLLLKRGGWREVAFVMADRWARLKGPIRPSTLSWGGRPLTAPVVSHGLKGDDLA
jgi:glycosyltransferase involved in cell wall biosynthesis